mmetsp:Transcript_135419/g.235504  ORF Transcript_135419/g.235504 Transcript_135419/m.235504 type:complete len:195 (+) Transcript_135419:81-665(+)
MMSPLHFSFVALITMLFVAEMQCSENSCSRDGICDGTPEDNKIEVRTQAAVGATQKCKCFASVEGTCHCEAGCDEAQRISICEELVGSAEDLEQSMDESSELLADQDVPSKGYTFNPFDENGNLNGRAIARLCAWIAATVAVMNIIYKHILELVTMSKRISDISEAADLAAQAAADQRAMRERRTASKQTKPMA